MNAGPGPLSRSRNDLRTYRWPSHENFNGLSFVRSKIGHAQVTDGLSNTYYVGEKYVSTDDDTGFGGDDQSMYVGDDADVRRWGSVPPLNDRSRVQSRAAFGSRHAGVCQFVLADGSVQAVSFSIDANVHRLLSNRRDGQPFTMP